MKEPLSNLMLVHDTCGINKPTTSQLNSLKVGQAVKISDNKERFWVNIIEVESNNLKVKVANNLVNEHTFKYGDVITIKKDDIIGLDTNWN
jgi:uncharacterized protein YegJ (DUF2314 family)